MQVKLLSVSISASFIHCLFDVSASFGINDDKL
jgi:hypothetical protein